ncbi:porin family protein [Hanstruepera flava]|uniref:porin family protein n=1 Tax=Hanstruepera flava TaxID=2930218 RepID=UPI00202819DB|nr:porin family protein [Hanstruepera flava]
MKKYFLIITFLLVGITAQSQILISLLLGDKLNSDGLEFGLETGFNWSNISNLDSSKSLATWNLGFYFDIRMKNQWYLYTGVLAKSNLGLHKLTTADLELLDATIYEEKGDYSQKMNYFLVPALAKYKFDNYMYVEGGPQFGLMYKSWIEYNSDEGGKEAKIKEFNKDMINKFDAGFTFGLGYNIGKGKGMTIGAKYYFGLIDVYKDISGTKNNSLFLKVNIPIGAGKKSESVKKNE